MKEDIIAADRAHVWHPYTRPSTLDAGLPVMVRGQGIHLFDEKGRDYLDAISSWWCCALGHGHPRLLEKLGLQNDVEVARYALRHRLVD